VFAVERAAVGTNINTGIESSLELVKQTFGNINWFLVEDEISGPFVKGINVVVPFRYGEL